MPQEARSVQQEPKSATTKVKTAVIELDIPTQVVEHHEIVARIK
jgi:hypothetical protein